MSINFIPNDPLAGAAAPGLRVIDNRPNRPAGRAGFTYSHRSPEDTYGPGTPGFLFWQCREASLAAVEAWETFAGQLKKWQGNRKKISLLQDAGEDLNAYYDRDSFSFFHKAIGGQTFFSGVSTDVVSHEVGHGLLDAIRPQLWDAPFMEAGAFHEAFGDCIAILTALNDLETRESLLALAAALRETNFVETTAEELSAGIRCLAPSHNAAEPRHALNTLQFQIPETLPEDGGPGALINEVHSFGMVFTGCFYDLIAGLFADGADQSAAGLLVAARRAGTLLVEGARTALITPRFFQAVGRAMVFADDQINQGANRDRIRTAFQAHNVMLGSNAMLMPTAALHGEAPRVGRRASIAASTRRDLAARMGAPGAKMSVEGTEVQGQQFAQVTQTRAVPLGSVDRRLAGVSVEVTIPVIVGASGRRAAVMGHMPEAVSTEREVQAFVASLVQHGQIEFAGKTASAPKKRAAVGKTIAAKEPISRETHRVATDGGKKTLQRIRFHCGGR